MDRGVDLHGVQVCCCGGWSLVKVSKNLAMSGRAYFSVWWVRVFFRLDLRA